MTQAQVVSTALNHRVRTMIKLTPIHCPRVWGYEDWIASTHTDGCQKELAAATGDYPLLVKIIQADDTLSVQVHPDDETAMRLEGNAARGKTECWYVLDASPNGAVIYGLKKNCTTDELKEAIKTNTLETKLNKVSVKKGDFAFIPAGSVHAICGGVRLLEVQQNCNITYRLYDWGRGRELHIEKGLASIHHADRSPVAPMQDEFSCDYFTLKKISVRGGYTFLVPKTAQKGSADGVGKTESPAQDTGKGWQLLFIASGTGTIRTTSTDGNNSEPIAFEKEQIFALAPEEKVTVEGMCEIIRIMSPHSA